MWSATYGNIPHGWEVHHKDGDLDHNEIDNFVAMAPLDHKVMPRKGMPKTQMICVQCGEGYFGMRQGGSRANRFCSARCRNRWNYVNRRQ